MINLQTFNKKDVVSKFEDIIEAPCPAGFPCFQNENQIIFYNIIFDHSTNFPTVAEAIKTDKSLHVQLQYYSKPVPLPEWFTKGRNAKLTRFSMLENFQPYLRSFFEKKGLVCLFYLKDKMLSFFTPVNKWWKIANAKKRFALNTLGNAITAGNGKMDFFQCFAGWLEEWSLNGSSAFALTEQISSALVQTLYAQCLSVKDLLVDRFDYVRFGKLQSDPLEKRFFQYRQMEDF